MVSTPAYCDLEIGSPVSVNIEVVTGNSRDPKCSEPIEFTYQPLVKVQPVQNAVSCQGVILQQDCNINGLLGGQFTTVQGGVVTGTTVNRDFSAVGDLLVINQAAQLPETTADNPVLLAHQLQPDQRGEILFASCVFFVSSVSSVIENLCIQWVLSLTALLLFV